MLSRFEVRGLPEKLRKIIEQTPVEGMKLKPFLYNDVEVNKGQVQVERVMLLGDAAHSMYPCKSSCVVSSPPAPRNDETIEKRIGKKRHIMFSGFLTRIHLDFYSVQSGARALSMHYLPRYPLAAQFRESEGQVATRLRQNRSSKIARIKFLSVVLRPSGQAGESIFRKSKRRL